MRYKLRWNVNRVDNRPMNFFEKLPATSVAPQGPPILSLRVSRSASDLNLSKTNLTLDRTGTNARLILEQNLFFFFLYKYRGADRMRKQLLCEHVFPPRSKTRLGWKDLLNGRDSYLIFLLQRVLVVKIYYTIFPLPHRGCWSFRIV